MNKNKEEQAGDYTMIAKTIYGLEDVLASELLKLGAKKIETHNRAVTFSGDIGFMYKANLSLRTALRVLKPIHSFEVVNEESLYRDIYDFEWESLIGPENTIAVDCVLNTPLFNHSMYISQKTKDAIVDRFRDKFEKRPSVELTNPDLRISIHISGNTCSVALDSSGYSLHKRGYREATGIAPINEVLAAGLVMLTGWERHLPLIDPMCGSGTILAEAALIANNIPPGYFRETFGFQKWKDYDAKLFELILESTVNKIKNDDYVKIIGCEKEPDVAQIASENIKHAKVDDVVTINTGNFEDFNPPQSKGVVIMNPPYGERMNEEDISALYKKIGDTLKQKYQGYDAWIISSNPEAFKSVGLRPSRKITVFNGPLECRYMKFEMYQGTKKLHKVREREERENEQKENKD
ncbi:MAG: class I SAM-dependent RNA methyltransferase [Bacteroidota bacterium]|nr:class I SAM-dependent RNA methyltransferase [Bacteroidota bacterium]